MADVPAGKLRCVVVTPEKTLIDVVVEHVVVPLSDGELGVLPGRQPLVARLGAGELRLGFGEKATRYFVDTGFVQVRGDVVTVLTTQALEPAKIDQAKAEALLRKANTDTTIPIAERTRMADSARGMLRVAAGPVKTL
jgi:F-type H+-transporting ATPase subunit epsilon